MIYRVLWIYPDYDLKWFIMYGIEISIISVPFLKITEKGTCHIIKFKFEIDLLKIIWDVREIKNEGRVGYY